MVLLHSLFFQVLALVVFFFCGCVSADTLKTVGAYTCTGYDESIINVQNFTFVFDRNTSTVTYHVQGTSTQNVSVIGKYLSLSLTVFTLCFFFFFF